MPKVSTRVQKLQDSPIRKLVPYADDAKAKGVTVHHLNIGQPDIHTPDEFWEAIHSFDAKVLAYSKSEGIDSYRKKLVNYYQKFDIEVDDSEIIVTVGGSEAIIFAMLATMNPGDEIIIPEPFYANYNGFAAEAGVKIVPITSKVEDDFALPKVSEFEKLISKKTKAILICNPSNPTGKLYSKEEIQALAKLVNKHDLFLIADEVYKEMVYDDEQFHSIMAFPELAEYAVVVDSVSKKYSACGARLGAFLSHNKKLVDAVMKLARARLAPPTLDQVGSEAMIDVNDYYISYVKSEYEGRRDVLINGLAKISDVEYSEIKGAMYAMVKLPVNNSEKFCKWLLTDFSDNDETIMLAPGTGFYATPGLGMDEVRIAFVLRKPKLARAMQILKTALEQYKEIEDLKS